MTTEAEKILDAFLKRPRPEMLIIKGQYGVGKTYFYNQWLKNIKKLDAFDKLFSFLKKNTHAEYAVYVSLFSINNIEDLRKKITESFYEAKAINPKFQTFNQFKITVKKLTPYLFYPILLFIFFLVLVLFKRLGMEFLSPITDIIDPYFLNISYDNNENRIQLSIIPILITLITVLCKLLEKFMSDRWATVKNCLICFDDYDRKSEALSARDFFGLVTELKDKKRCKIVLILNEDTVFKEKKNDGRCDWGEYIKNKEKVIDREITFKPDQYKLFKIALNVAGKENLDTSLLNDLHKKIGTVNIRILIKVIYNISEFMENINKSYYYKNLSSKDQIQLAAELYLRIFQFTLLNDAPPDMSCNLLEFKKTSQNKFHEIIGLDLDRLKDDNDKKLWYFTDFINRTTDYNTGFTDYDSLIDFIIHGLFDFEHIEEMLRKLNEEINRRNINELINSNLAIFYKSMENHLFGSEKANKSINEILDNLSNAIYRGIRYDINSNHHVCCVFSVLVGEVNKKIAIKFLNDFCLNAYNLKPSILMNFTGSKPLEDKAYQVAKEKIWKQYCQFLDSKAVKLEEECKNNWNKFIDVCLIETVKDRVLIPESLYWSALAKYIPEGHLCLYISRLTDLQKIEAINTLANIHNYTNEFVKINFSGVASVISKAIAKSKLF